MFIKYQTNNKALNAIEIIAAGLYAPRLINIVYALIDLHLYSLAVWYARLLIKGVI